MVVNKEYQSLYHMQDKLIEHKVERYTGKFAVSVGYFIERAGDVYRELFKHGGEFIDFGYIESKVKTLRNEFSRARDTAANQRELYQGRREYPAIAGAYDAYAMIEYIPNIKKLRNETKVRAKNRHLMRAGMAALDVVQALTLWGMTKYSPEQVSKKIKVLDTTLIQLMNQKQFQ